MADDPIHKGLPVLGFADAAALEAWLAERPLDAAGFWVKVPKKASGETGPTRSEVVDAVLATGWIDGQAAAWDDAFSLLRLTPRRAKSRWSEINRERVAALEAAGRMHAAGLAEVAAAKADGRWDAAYPPASRAVVPDDLQAALDAEPEAASFFATLTGASRYAVLYRIHHVKRAETRARKVAEMVAMLKRGEAIRG